MTSPPSPDFGAFCMNLSITLGQRQSHVLPSERASGSTAERILFYIFITLILVNMIVFTLAKLVVFHTSKRLQVRSLLTPLCTHLALLLCLINSFYFYSAPLQNIPCWFEKSSMFMIAPLCGLPFAARLLIFSRSYHVNISMAKAVKAERPYFSTSSSRRPSSLRKFNGSRLSIPGPPPPSVGGGNGNGNGPGNGGRNSSVSGTRQAISNASSLASGARGSRLSLIGESIFSALVMKLIDLTGRPSTTTLLLVLLFPYLVTAIVIPAINPMVQAGCWGCMDTFTETILLLTGFLVTFSIVCLALLMVRGIPDPFQICREIKTSLWISLIAIGGYVGAAFQGLKPGDEWNWDIVVNFALYGVCFVTTIVQVILVLTLRIKENERRASLSTSSTSPRPSLARISTWQGISTSVERFLEVYGADTRPYLAFEKALINEQSVESLVFYEEVMTWKRTFDEMPPSVARTWAKQICEMFLLESSKYEVNVSWIAKQNVLQRAYDPSLVTNIDMQESSEDLSTVFDVVQHEVAILMQEDGFARFRVSDEWRKLIRAGDLAAGQQPSVDASSPPSSPELKPNLTVVGGGGGQSIISGNGSILAASEPEQAVHLDDQSLPDGGGIDERKESWLANV